MRKGLTAICGTALGVCLLAPASASAVPTCVQVADQLTVTADATTPQVSVDRSGSQIRAFAGAIGAGTDLCDDGTPPTVTDVDNIQIDDVAAHPLAVLISLQGGTFETGEDVAEVPGPEIEIFVQLSDQTDRLEVEGSDNADTFDIGQQNPQEPLFNLNPAADGANPDCDDIRGTGIEEVIVHGRGGDDDLNASGCGALGSLSGGTLRSIEGNNAKDFVRGGSAADTVSGGSADDNVNGGAGDDAVNGDTDDDRVDGGAGADGIEGGDGTDRVLYDDRATPQNVTVGNGGADDGGGEDQSGGNRDNVGTTVEHVTGGAAGDSITGSGIRNVLNGGLGDDVLLGLGGNDDVEGEGGNDTADGGDGKDDVRGADGTDTGRGGPGADDVRGGNQADKLFGGSGGDFLKGDKGKDSMSGQAGNDRIAAKDKKKDQKISCGKGKAKKESATVDKSDPKARSC